MLVLGVTAALGAACGTLAWLVIRRSWNADPGAPRLERATVVTEVRRHPAVASWLAARVDPSVATGSLLTVAVAMFVIGAGGVGVLLLMIRAHSGFALFDLGAAKWAARHATPFSTHGLRVLTQFGGAVVLVPAVAVVAAVEVRRTRRWAVASFLSLVVVGQFLVANLIKDFVDRARPDVSRLTGFSSTSFPSGHATAAAAVFAAVALVASRNRPRATKAALGGAAVGLAVMVAASRVFLGVHWLTDVLAGLCLGWAWFALCSVAFGGRLLHFGAAVETAEATAAALERTGPLR